MFSRALVPNSSESFCEGKLVCYIASNRNRLVSVERRRTKQNWGITYPWFRCVTETRVVSFNLYNIFKTFEHLKIRKMVSGGMACVKYLLFVFNLIFAVSIYLLAILNKDRNCILSDEKMLFHCLSGSKPALLTRSVTKTLWKSLMFFELIIITEIRFLRYKIFRGIQECFVPVGSIEVLLRSTTSRRLCVYNLHFVENSWCFGLILSIFICVIAITTRVACFFH